MFDPIGIYKQMITPSFNFFQKWSRARIRCLIAVQWLVPLLTSTTVSLNLGQMTVVDFEIGALLRLQVRRCARSRRRLQLHGRGSHGE